MRLAIIGLGLIGGSIARAARSGRWPSSFDEISAWSPTGAGPAAALADGVIDQAAGSLSAAIERADLVVLAADPLTCLDLLDAVAALASAERSPTVTDVASTKGEIVGRADRLELPFVGGHPMAGLETSGYGHSRADLFDGRPWVLSPGRFARPIDLERTEQLVAACGGEPVRLDPAAHDTAVAAISHLPLVLAAALVQAVGNGDDWPLARTLAAGGWGSATRLARGDVAMGAGIAATNAPELARRIRSLAAELEGWLADLESTPDDLAATADRLEVRLRAAQAVLEAGD
ncbi:MAG TPA: prephenate dehydrogenase/arogenate dehydrogenase family protein [Candidatus Limnocylindrales bacterium]